MDVGPELLARFLVQVSWSVPRNVMGPMKWSACTGKISDGFSPAVRKGRHQRLLHIFCEMMHDVFTVGHKHMYPNIVLRDLLKTWATSRSVHATRRWGNAFNPEGQRSPLFIDSNKLLGVSKYELMKPEQAESQREQVTTPTRDNFVYSLYHGGGSALLKGTAWLQALTHHPQWPHSSVQLALPGLKMGHREGAWQCWLNSYGK